MLLLICKLFDSEIYGLKSRKNDEVNRSKF
jgi:hypothetical protein